MRTRVIIAVSFSLLLVAGCSSGSGSTPSEAPEARTVPSETQPMHQQREEAPAPATDAPADDEGEHELPDDLEAGATGHFGSTFALETEPVPVETALETCADTGTPCRVSGRIATVCQNRGCWFTVESDATEHTIRVRMQDYAFFVPRNTGGAEVELEGLLTRRLVPVDEVQHYAEDAARAAGEEAEVPVITEPEVTWEFMATAVRITMP